MDWLLETEPTRGGEMAPALIVEHLRRHALSPDDVRVAEPVVAAALALPSGAATWAHLEWDGAQPVLELRARPEPVDPGRSGAEALAEGVWAADRTTAELAELFPGPPARIALPVVRAATVDIDLLPERSGPESAAGYQGAVAAILAGQTDAGATLAEAAAVAGASAAPAAIAGWADRHGRAPAGAAEIAQAFADFANAAGGGFTVIEVDGDDRRAVLSNRRCHFGVAAAGREVLCRTTSALLGSLGARAEGAASVSVDGAIAGGDHRCRVVLDLDAAPSRWSHSYRWPPAGPLGTSEDSSSRGFRVSLGLQLPRDHLSVPLIRHIVRAALTEVGAAADDVDAVEIAVSEAAGNVIRHSGSGDAYEVQLVIGPLLAELRVVDIGRGFDSDALLQSEARAGEDDELGHSAESGRGMALMHALVDQARFESAPERGTIVHLVKRLHFDDDSPARRLMLDQLGTREDPPAPDKA